MVSTTPYILTSFERSRFGRLPTELLQIVTRSLPKYNLPAVARISPTLRELAERRLYHTINMPYMREDREDTPLVVKHDMWALCRTLSQCPDFGKKVKSMDILTRNVVRSHVAPTSNILPGLPFIHEIALPMSEILVTGILLQRIPNVETLALKINRDNDGLVPRCMTKLFSDFEPLTAHLQKLPMFQALRHFELHGDEFHWILAQSPTLESLKLARATTIFPDVTPEELNPSVKQISLAYRSAILVSRYGTLFPFLAHFPSLANLCIHINDMLSMDHTNWDPEDISTHEQGSYTTLLSKLQPVTASLTTLDLFIGSSMWDQSLEYLLYTLPSAGFLEISVLTHLCVLYACLFAPADPQWSYIMTAMSELLPPSIERLELYCPRSPYTTG
jgi:hypothetical protein